MEDLSNTHAITSSQYCFTVIRPCVNSLYSLRSNEKGVLAIIFPVDCVPLTGCNMSKIPKLSHLPVRGDIPQPVDAGGLERHVGVEAEGDGPLDGGLAGFLQEGDQLLFGVDVALDAAVDVVEIAGDGTLFGEGWEGTLHVSDE